MQLMGYNGKLKAIDIFLSWLLLFRNICPTFSFLEPHLCSVKKYQGTFRLLGRCIPPSSGVLEWNRVKSQLLLICTFLLHPLNCATKSEALHTLSPKMCHLILPHQEKTGQQLKSSNCSHTKSARTESWCSPSFSMQSVSCTRSSGDMCFPSHVSILSRYLLSPDSSSKIENIQRLLTYRSFQDRKMLPVPFCCRVSTVPLILGAVHFSCQLNHHTWSLWRETISKPENIQQQLPHKRLKDRRLLLEFTLPCSP